MEKKKKISDSELRLILLLLSVLLLAAAYFLVYNRTVTAAQDLEAQNEIDQATVDRLEAMVAVRAQVEAETEQLRQNIKEIVAKYPSDLTTEKAISIVQNIENASGVEYPSVNFRMGNLLRDFSYPNEETNLIPTGYYAGLSMNYAVSYAGFKEMMTYIYGLRDRMTVPTVSMTYDHVTDMVSGSVTMNLYYLTNTGKEYNAPEINDIENGVDNIFGGAVGVAPVQEEETADETEADAETETAESAEE